MHLGYRRVYFSRFYPRVEVDIVTYFPKALMAGVWTHLESQECRFSIQVFLIWQNISLFWQFFFPQILTILYWNTSCHDWQWIKQQYWSNCWINNYRVDEKQLPVTIAASVSIACLATGLSIMTWYGKAEGKIEFMPHFLKKVTKNSHDQKLTVEWYFIIALIKEM